MYEMLDELLETILMTRQMCHLTAKVLTIAINACHFSHLYAF